MSSSKIMATSLDESVFDGVAREESVQSVLTGQQEVLSAVEDVKVQVESSASSGDDAEQLHVTSHYSYSNTYSSFTELLNVSGSGQLYGVAFELDASSKATMGVKIEIDGEIVFCYNRTNGYSENNMLYGGIFDYNTCVSGSTVYVPITYQNNMMGSEYSCCGMLGVTLSSSSGHGEFVSLNNIEHTDSTCTEQTMRYICLINKPLKFNTNVKVSVKKSSTGAIYLTALHTLK